MEYKIAVVPGDGIGVDVIREAVRVLDKVGEVYGHTFHKEYLRLSYVFQDCATDHCATGIACFTLMQIDFIFHF